MEDSSVKYSIESPISNRLQSRSVTIRGWCFEDSEENLRGIRAWVGEEKFVAKRKQSRPQIGILFPDTKEAARSGFNVELTLPRGGGSVTLEARTSDGNWQLFETLSFKAPWFHWPWQKLDRATQDPNHEYQLWIERHDTLNESERSRIRSRIELMENPPTISIIVPVYNPDERWLRKMIESVQTQLYPHWELCLADDVSTQTHVRKVLEEASSSDPRIKVTFRSENGHISAASNSALELASGEFIALLDHDDELPAHALYWVAEEIAEHPDVDIIFSDEDKITEKGSRLAPYFKSDFNYDLFLAQNCLSHLGVYRTRLVREINGFRMGMEGSQDWDLALRALEKSNPEKIRHIPKILYHWRVIPGSTALSNDEKPYASEAGLRTIKQHLERQGSPQAQVEFTEGFLRVIWPLPDSPPPVSLIMPTRNMAGLLKIAVRSLLDLTSYPDFELIIVDNDSDEPETLLFLEKIAKDARVRIFSFSGEFNFSKINNFAISQTSRPIVGLLNNDLEIVEKSWLEEMVGQACRPDIGAVAPLLLYPNGTIQHAGTVIGMISGAGHPFRKSSDPSMTQGGRAYLVQNYSALTAACMVVKRELYLEVDGLDEGDFKVGLNDIDFCLKLRQAGYRNLYTPFAQLIHHESASRADMERTSTGANRAAGENAALSAKWPEYFAHDPCWNPNLSLLKEDGSLAFPPRLPEIKA